MVNPPFRVTCVILTYLVTYSAYFNHSPVMSWNKRTTEKRKKKPYQNSKMFSNFYLKEGHCGPAVESSVFDLGLFGEILGALDVLHHPLDRQEGGQVGGVRRYHDQRKEPPNTSYHSSRNRTGSDLTT